MAIKAEADRIHFETRPDERELAVRLGESFDVSHGTPSRGFSAWILRPKPQIVERFGFDQEILLVYSPHNRTDARAMNEIRELLAEPRESTRLDGVVSLLLHRGSEADVQPLIERETERVVIPFTCDELLDPHRGDFFIRSRLAHVLGQVDLFGLRAPISSDHYFFGRNEVVQSLRTAAARGEHRGLFGLRKTGKTSVLYALGRRWRGSDTFGVLVDCQNPGIHAARWWQALENIIGKVVDALREETGKRVNITGGYVPTDAGVRFSTDIKTIMRTAGVDRLVLMFDEVEYITATISGPLGKHWDDDFVPFWQVMRSISQEMLGRLTWIVSGVNGSLVNQAHIGGRSNPVFQLARPEYLVPFDDTATRQLVRTTGKYLGVRFDEDVYSWLNSHYGGHPYLIRVACSTLLRHLDTSDPNRAALVGVSDFEDRHAEIGASMAEPLKDILLSLVWWYQEEFEALRVLAEGDESFFREYLSSEPAVAERFHSYGLVAVDGSLRLPMLANFLRDSGQELIQNVGPFTRTEFAQDQIPEVPDLAVLADLFDKRTEVEILLRRAISLYVGLACNWNEEAMAAKVAPSMTKRADRPNPASLFVDRSLRVVVHDMYMNDLQSVVLGNWDLMSPLFDQNKERFRMNMDTINLARRADAHTKPVSKEEGEDFLNSYHWLRQKLAKVAPEA